MSERKYPMLTAMIVGIGSFSEADAKEANMDAVDAVIMLTVRKILGTINSSVCVNSVNGDTKQKMPSDALTEVLVAGLALAFKDGEGSLDPERASLARDFLDGWRETSARLAATYEMNKAGMQ